MEVGAIYCPLASGLKKVERLGLKTLPEKRVEANAFHLDDGPIMITPARAPGLQVNETP
jgi:hypothetical protein